MKRRDSSKSRTAQLSSHAQRPTRQKVKYPVVPLALGIVLGFVSCPVSALGQVRPLTFDTNIKLKTDQLGDVEHPSEQQLDEMHARQFILRARDGRLTKVWAEKSRLPFDREFHPQGGILYRAHDLLIYAKQKTTLSKSTDGGRTWTSWKIEPPPAGESEKWQVSKDGTFVRVSMTTGEGVTGPAKVCRSRDEGRTWQKIAELPIEVRGGYKARYAHWRMTKLPDDTIFYGIDLRDDKYGGDRFLSAGTVLTVWRSTDKGETWQGPIKICNWVAEGGIAQLPSGKLLASVRYQRGTLPTDTPAVRQLSGDKRGFKHHFLVESDDGSLTWKNLRPLTTVYSQCYGYPAAQSDGTVVVIHDTRYGPGPDAARAMISYDDGKTWENEVYYVYFGKGQSSYSQSIVLDDDTILTLGGTSTHPDTKKRWDASIGHSHLTAIRWKPVKEASRKGAEAARRKALNRRRRVIFNDDTYELSREDANTPEGFLRRRLKLLVGTHVDTIAWSILGG